MYLVQKARIFSNGSMIGTGFTPEGHTDSYITTELMSEMSWRKEPVQNIKSWIEQYLLRRYGKNNIHSLKAWDILSKNVLNSTVGHFNQNVLLVKIPSQRMTDYTWYPLSDLSEAWNEMILASSDSELKNEPGFQ